MNITCIQETKWAGSKAREIDRFKLWYSGGTRARNWVSILVDKELSDQVIQVRCKSDRVMSIKLVAGAKILNVIWVCAPQVGLADDIKKVFWEELDRGCSTECISKWETLYRGILIGILPRRQMGMIWHMEVLDLGKETVEGSQFWTLLLLLIWWLLTLFLRKRKII